MPRLRILSRNALQVGLHCLQVDDVEQRDVRDQRRHDGMLEHLHVRNTDVLHHQEGGGTHHRRHDLAVDRAGHFDRGGFVGAIADALHQRDGEGTGGHHVGNGRTGNHTCCCRGHHGRFGRTPAQVTQQADRALDEIVTRTGRLQQRTEQHEQKDETGRDAERHTKHTFRRQPQVAHALAQRSPFVGNHVGHMWPGKDVDDEHDGQNHHRQAERATCGLKQQHHASDSNDQVVVGGATGALRQLCVKQKQIGCTKRADRSQEPIDSGYVLPRRAFECRVSRECKEH